MASKTIPPTHEQGQLQLQLFEQRREPRLRQARDWFQNNLFAETLDDAFRLAGPGTENGVNFMMVVSYWDQACAFLNHGLLHEELFFETTGEFFGVWERVKPTMSEARERFGNKLFLANLEQAANRFETFMEQRSPGAVAAMRNMQQMMRKQGKAAA
jgi:hypothetical protein